MDKIKVGSTKEKNRAKNRTSINTVTGSKHVKKTSREKIIIKEKRSIMLNNIKNFLKINILKIAIVLLALLIILIYTNSVKKISVDETTNISKLNSNKYSSEIVNLYNRDGELDRFTTEMNRVQSLIGMYLVSNSTLDNNSFSKLIKTLNSEINNDKWLDLDSQKSNYYNGIYWVDDSGNLKFKFDSKTIEPSWINSENISRYVVLN